MFVHLHNHTSFSLLDGVGNPDVWVARAKEMGFDAIGISDHGTISGAVDFYKACKEEGIKGVIGIEGYVTPDLDYRIEQEEPEYVKERKAYKRNGLEPPPEPRTAWRGDRFHVCIYAKNDNGLKSITHTMTKANDERGFYRKPRITPEQLLEMEDVIVTSACLWGLARLERFKRGYLAQCKEAFGDDFYLELHPHDLDEQREINREIVMHARRLGISLTVGEDCHYPTQEMEATQAILFATRGRQTLAEYLKDPWFKTKELYLKTPRAIAKMFRLYHPSIPPEVWRGAMEATSEIAAKCDLSLEPRKVVLPDVPSAEAKLNKLVKIGFKKRFAGLPRQEYIDRVNMEMRVIRKQGFLDYFVIVHDLVQWCHKEKIMLGPGRGSVGGSLVAYLLGIHHLDPIKYNLYFERFLNPGRIAPPDIDMDFAQDRRGEVVNYIIGRYGLDRVANIATFLKMKARTSFKDCARAYAVPAPTANYYSQRIDDEAGLKESIKQDDELKEFARRHLDVVRHALILEGQIRSTGQHPAGVVVADRPLRDMAVLEHRKGIQVVNWDMEDAEHLGLLKLDVLGLRTCAVIKETLDLINNKRFRHDNIWSLVQSRRLGSLNDRKVLDEFSQANTIGVFQFEKSAGMKMLLQDLAPIKSFNTLADATALFRPGPKNSGLTAQYVKVYRGEAVPNFIHPVMKKITSETHGAIIFQEQTMAIARDLAGFSLERADTLRKAIGKKKAKLMETMHEEFVNGCMDHSGITEDQAKEIWGQLEEHASYSFNLAHSVEYSLISYVCMWMKVYFPVEFFCAQLRYESADDEKLRSIKIELDRLKIKVLPPSLMRSQNIPTIDGRDLRLGLARVKGVGPVALEAIEAARPFKSFDEFLSKIERRKCNKKVIESLIKAGAVTGLTEEQAEEFVPGMTERDILESQNEVLGAFSTVKATQEPFGKAKLQKVLGMRKDILACRECDIWRHTGFKAPVFPTFGLDAQYMLVAESPGQQEDQSGRVLVGKSGARINHMISQVGLSRDDFYLTNIHKCRPADNKLPKDPPKDCHKWLKREMEILKPSVLVAVGRYSAGFFGMKGSIIEQSGEPFWNDGFKVWIIPCVHPGWVFRNGNKGNDLMLKAFKALFEMTR